MGDSADAFLRRLAERYPVDPRYLQNIRPLVARIFARDLPPAERRRLLRLVEENLRRQAEARRSPGETPFPAAPVWAADTAPEAPAPPVRPRPPFGEWLLARGVLRPHTLLGALEEQVRARPLVGWLARKRGLLGAGQVLAILRRQAHEPRRFLELAQSLGYLDGREAELLLWLQRRYTPRLGRLLVERGDLTEAALQYFLEEYRLAET